MIRYVIVLFIGVALGATANSQISIVYSGAVGESNVVNSLGTAINGDTVSIGAFPSTFDPAANAGNLAAIEANWVNFDSTSTVTLFGVNGRFSRQSSPVNNSFFDGKHIYLWINQTSGSTITEYGLFTSTSTDWIFPAHDSPIPPNPISSNEVNDFLFGDGISSGSPGSVTPGSLQTAVVAVPEPGGIALLGIGLVISRLYCRRNR
jgi:hypothetical protein